MKKTELLKLVEALRDEEDINETLKAIEEFKIGSAESIDLTKLTIDDYKNILENNATIKGYNQSRLDSAISIAIASHDDKFSKDKLPKIIEDELRKKSNENKTPEQIALEELQARFDNLEAEKARAEMSNKYTKVLGEKGLPIELIDYVLGGDDELTNSNIDKIGALFTGAIQASTKKIVNDNGYVPPGGDSANVTKNPFAKETFNLTEQGKMLKENPELAKTLMNTDK